MMCSHSVNVTKYETYSSSVKAKLIIKVIIEVE
jgi:hypothetical protein